MAALSDRGHDVPFNYRSLYPIDPHAASAVDRDLLEEASHELKTPLSSIRNSLTLLKLGAAGPIPKDALAVLDVVERNTARLMDLIEEILFAQRETLVLEPLRADNIISSAIDMVSGELIAKEIELQFVRSNLIVLGDEKKLVQVLVNLLSNAIKFSPANGPIKIQTQTQSTHSLTISVSDQGPGVPDGDLERIFLKHEQGQSLREHGAGLGLAIAKRIIEKHGGQIGIYNGISGGATFWVRLNRVAKSVERTSSSPSLSDGKVA